MKAMNRVARILVSIAVMLVTTTTIPATAQTDQAFEKAMAAYKQRDYVMALALFGAAAEEGHPDAQFLLATMYASGQGVSQNDAEAAQWCRRAAEQGHSRAEYILGLMYAEGKGVSQSATEAVRWFRRAAEQGHAGAQLSLGLTYVFGRGVREDDAQAAQWFRRAAEQGHAEAQFNLRMMYAAGTGVRQDNAQAVQWLRRAAEQNHAEAQFRLGVMYGAGTGVRQDAANALQWFRRAAEQGSPDAQTLLKNMPKGEIQGNPLSEIELYVASRIAESLDEPDYSFMKRCDPEDVFQMASATFKRMYELGRDIDVRKSTGRVYDLVTRSDCKFRAPIGGEGGGE